MTLHNKTEWPDWFLRRLLAFCCRELGYPVRRLQAAEFTATRRGQSYRGRAWGRHILVRVGPASFFPLTGNSRGTKMLPPFTIADRVECLVLVTAHELAHCRSFWRPREYGNGEGVIDLAARRVVERFRVDRERLMAAWEKPPSTRAAKPKPSEQERELAHAEKMARAWEKKLSLARTKAVKYRRRLLYLQRKAAMTPSKGGEHET